MNIIKKYLLKHYGSQVLEYQWSSSFKNEKNETVPLGCMDFWNIYLGLNNRFTEVLNKFCMILHNLILSPLRLYIKYYKWKNNLHDNPNADNEYYFSEERQKFWTEVNHYKLGKSMKIKQL